MLQHPHIIKLHEAFVCDSHLNIVLELAECGSAMEALEAYTHKGAGMHESQARCVLVGVPGTGGSPRYWWESPHEGSNLLEEPLHTCSAIRWFWEQLDSGCTVHRTGRRARHLCGVSGEKICITP